MSIKYLVLYSRVKLQESRKELCCQGARLKLQASDFRSQNKGAWSDVTGLRFSACETLEKRFFVHKKTSFLLNRLESLSKFVETALAMSICVISVTHINH